ncbi:acid-sensing ion channel 1B-like [Corythoichthys intestinalis]|uniref:acid-sensing ion channel 1B-like n=1 Tax=Corythoichthys intestinalis TaxID=161448 RepID=UPI0025A64014|nr:acid-sensing ion channel 1B-like [Corythoichthys intestinalis]
MPVRIMCTISFSGDDEGYGKDSFDDHYKRVNRGYGDSQEYLDGCSHTDDYEEEEESPGEVDDLATFFSGCSLHGANHVFVENKKFGIRQSLWAVVFTMALSAFLFQVADRVIYYLQYDHITMLDEKVAQNMTFPAVTICNYNFVRKSQLSYSDLIFMGPLLGFDEGMAPGFPLAPEPDRPPGSVFSVDEIYNRTRHRIEDILLECNFRGLECGPENFREVGLTLRFSQSQSDGCSLVWDLTALQVVFSLL